MRKFPAKVSFEVSPRVHADELMRKLASAAKDKNACTAIPSRRLGGQDIEMIILALGTAGFVTAAARIIVEWIRGKNGYVKIGPITMHNPSPQEVMVALREAAKIIRSEDSASRHKTTQAASGKTKQRKAKHES